MKEKSEQILKMERQIQENEKYKEEIEEKFREWEATFQTEQKKSLLAIQRLEDLLKKKENDKTALLDQLKIKDNELSDMKLKLTSQDTLLHSNNDLRYELQKA